MRLLLLTIAYTAVNTCISLFFHLVIGIDYPGFAWALIGLMSGLMAMFHNLDNKIGLYHGQQKGAKRGAKKKTQGEVDKGPDNSGMP